MSLSRMNVTSIRAWSHAMTGDRPAMTLRGLRCGFSFSLWGISRSMRRANGFTNGNVSTPRRTEKTVSVTAMGAMMLARTGPLAVSVTAFQPGKRALPIGTSTGSTNGRKISEPRMFESVCASAVRRAAAEPPIAASQAVMVVPTFAPKRTAIDIS